MNARERFVSTIKFGRLDRPFFWETHNFWDKTLERWHQEGLPEEINKRLIYDYLGMDKIAFIPVEGGWAGTPYYPMFDEKIIEDRGENLVVLEKDGIIKMRKKGNDDENLTDRVIKFICKNYTNPITNKDISAHFNYHTNYINRMMVLNTGTSLRQYLINYRISKAIQLLKTTQKPITEIAYEVGFKDPNHFSKTFKKKVGVSPKEYAERTMGLI
jgi:AraC-like DNA-binding protein